MLFWRRTRYCMWVPSGYEFEISEIGEMASWACHRERLPKLTLKPIPPLKKRHHVAAQRAKGASGQREWTRSYLTAAVKQIGANAKPSTRCWARSRSFES